MQIFTGTETPAAVSSNYLSANLFLKPQILKKYIRLETDQYNLTMLNHVLGYGRTLTKASKAITNGKMKMSNQALTWAREPRIRQPLTVTTAPVGTGASHADITFEFAQNWVTAGMTLMFQDGLGGNVNIYVTTGSTYVAANRYSVVGHIIGESVATFNPALSPVGGQATWLGSAASECTNLATSVPVTSFDWFTNWTTNMPFSRQVCVSAIQDDIWLQADDGGAMCWLPIEERQVNIQNLKSMEYTLWNGLTSMASGTSTTLDQNGNAMVIGSGFWEQVQTSNITQYTIATAINLATQPAFLAAIKNSIVAWAIANSVTSTNNVLEVWAGRSAFGLLQEAWKLDAVTQGERLLRRDFESRMDDEKATESGHNTTQYNFAGWRLNLRLCSSFDDIGGNPAQYLGTVVPQRSWTFIIMPDLLNDGQPLMEIFFRDGNGISTGFVMKIIPGTFNPMEPNATLATSTLQGYTSYWLTECMLRVADPSKTLIFNGV